MMVNTAGALQVVQELNVSDLFRRIANRSEIEFCGFLKGYVFAKASGEKAGSTILQNEQKRAIAAKLVARLAFKGFQAQAPASHLLGLDCATGAEDFWPKAIWRLKPKPAAQREAHPHSATTYKERRNQICGTQKA